MRGCDRTGVLAISSIEKYNSYLSTVKTLSVYFRIREEYTGSGHAPEFFRYPVYVITCDVMIYHVILVRLAVVYMLTVQILQPGKRET